MKDVHKQKDHNFRPEEATKSIVESGEITKHKKKDMAKKINQHNRETMDKIFKKVKR